MTALDVLADWPVPAAAAAVVGPSGVLSTHGDTRRPYPLASVTKLLVARAAQVAVEEGAVALDAEAGPPGSTVRHLLAHAAGYEMTSSKVIAAPGTRRVYSNYGFTVLADVIEQESSIPFTEYLTQAVFDPLGLTDTVFEGGTAAAGYGATSTVDDLAAFTGDLLAPAIVSAQMHREAVTVQFPGLDGVLPGFGVQRPNDWGLGFEIRDGKSPHWTGAANSAGTFGHFGQSGTFLWVDPEAELGLVVLTDRQFGEWAHPVMPALSDEVLREFRPD
ncbi:penicillin-binding protein, beta-lactamase class C [Mycolicibacterium chubuense NBB4]|uniref:Penicillin-binding protein, beta-lactamase class C n=1 Tax=Mycolicibacterium chubuense (strain NBB4) TaxID=710421 RepID=I4BL74_MYCCN|nr:serine hydrolase domain-containing protein [Mycolicibacterium chubuense]AFM18031.1 penicillin-binding protein, beta-lactamase class C [Mycolicibacterium chubuense NBB4]